MEAHAGGNSGAAQAGLPTLSRLLAAGDPASVAEIVEGFGLWDRPAVASARPRVMLNMISTADGRATLDGRSGTISRGADRALFHGLRSAVDAVLVGAGTVRVERYGRIIPDASRRELRRGRGLGDEPLACIVSGTGAGGGHPPAGRARRTGGDRHGLGREPARERRPRRVRARWAYG